MRTPTLLAVSAAAAAVAVAGCGGGGSSTSTSANTTPAAATTTPAASSGGGGSDLKISADKSGALKFNTTSLSAKAGKVTITMSNPSQVQHGIGIKGGGVSQTGNVVGSGGTSTVTLTLKPGKYEFYCPVPGHEQAGMKGTLTVQ